MMNKMIIKHNKPRDIKRIRARINTKTVKTRLPRMMITNLNHLNQQYQPKYKLHLYTLTENQK